VLALRLNARISCVVLAAGAGRRFKAPQHKLVSFFNGKPLLQHAIDAASASHAMSCTVVSGGNTAEILSHVDLRRCSIVENSSWQEGIAATIRCGLAYHAADDACILLVGDQPFIYAADINNLINAFTQERNAIIALTASGVWGTPVLFPQADFRELNKLRGDHGAKRYAEKQQKRVRLLATVNQNALRDIDSVKDYQQLQAHAYRPR